MVTVTVGLVTSVTPPPVQVIVAGVLAGEAWSITGGTAGGLEWVIPGASGIGDGGQIAVVDTRAPLNTAVTYRVIVDGVLTVSDPITVPSAERAILQTLDGSDVLHFVWMDDGLPRDYEIRQAAFLVPGRRRPVIRYDIGADGGGELTIRTTQAMTRVMELMLYEGGPLVLRTDGTVRDLPPVEIITLTSASSRLWGGDGGLSTQRVWSLSYLLADDPAADIALGAATWDDFDAADLTWDQFDALDLTWDGFDTYDWRQLA